MEENKMSGNYRLHSEVGEKEREIFQEAMAHHLGVDYKPIAVASQVVNGINYIYICTGRVVVPDAEPKLYAIKIYIKFGRSVAPKISVESIEEIDVATLVKNSVSKK